MVRGVSGTVRVFSTLVLGFGMAWAGACRLQAQAPVAQPAVRITAAVDDAKRVTLTGNVHPQARAAFDLGAAPQATATGKVSLVLRRSDAQKKALTQYLADVHNPHSASYHKWLTPAQFGARFGVADADLKTVEAWLEGKGFKVERVAAARNLVQFSGTFGQVENAFHTSMHTFEVNGVRHVANAANPQIPAALAPVVAGVGPLHDFRPVSQAQLASHAKYNASTHKLEQDLTLFDSGGTSYLYVNPADAATIYDVPNAALNRNYHGTTYDGTGVSIGLVGDSNITMQDVTNYRVAFLGETADTANLPTVVVDGPDPGLNGDQGEALLDTEIAGGIAPKAKVYLYIAENSDLQTGVFDAFVRALDDNVVSTLNMSFSECEAGLGTAGNEFMNELMQQAVAQGISVTVSSGDSGSANCDRSNAPTANYGLAVNGLASSPFDIVVGGTDYNVLTTDFATYATNSSDGNPDSGTPPYYGTALSYIPERPWNDSTQSNEDFASNYPFLSNGSTNVIAAGGGASNCAVSTVDGSGNVNCQSGYAKPDFQSALTPADGVRDLPDVSFLAANGLNNAVWAICSDNVANGSSFPPYTDCETDNGLFTSNTSFSGVGGTSASAPAMSAFLALIGQKEGGRLGQADYVLYALAQSKYATIFHDVTEGNISVVCAPGSPNCGGNGFLTGYDAGTGYDTASGLGSLDVTQLMTNWESAGLGSTTTSFTINGSTAALNVVHGTTLTFAASVSPSAATGVVGVVDDANQTASGVKNNGQTMIQLSGGTGSTTYNGLPGGTYTVYAYYGGDSTNAASTSNGIPVTISAEDTNVAVAANFYRGDSSGASIGNLAAVPYGSILAATAQVQGKNEGANTQGIASGTISFTDNGATLSANEVLNASNTAAYEAPSTATPTVFTLGAHSLVATYSGDASYKAGASTPVSFTVVQAGTTLNISAAKTTVSSLASTQLTVAADTSSQGAFPTGTLTLSLNGTALTTVSNLLHGGGPTGGTESYFTFSLQGRQLNPGANTLTATYSGDGDYAASSGTLVVNMVQAGFTLKTSGGITVAPGATTGNTTTLSLSPTNGFTGVVNLSCSVTSTPADAASVPTCSLPQSVNITGTTVSASLAVATTTSTTPGDYVVTVNAVDASTGKLTGSTTVGVTVTGSATPAGFSLASSGGITVAPGATSANTATITVTPAGGFTGAVNLACAVTSGATTDAPTCGVPGSVTISGTSAATATLTVTTTAPTTAALHRERLGLSGLAAAALLVLWIPARRRRALQLLALLALAVSMGVVGCGGSSKQTTPPHGGTPAGNYTITVTGTDAATGKITAATTVSLNVN